MRSRILAAVVGLAFLVPAIIFGGQTTAEILSIVALIICADEYARMAAPGDQGAWALMLLSSFGLFSAMVWAPPAWIPGLLALLTVASLLYGMLAVAPVEKGAQVGVRLVAGLMWLPLLWSFIPPLRALDDGLVWLFVALGATWMGDTGAYFAGRFLGSHKLFERVSPKKTWEGVFGGVVAGALTTALIARLALPDLALGHAVAIGALLPSVGVLGDLTESMLKRAYGVKDSGWILPGHGGLLDRVDGLLFTIPTLYAYIYLFGLA